MFLIRSHAPRWVMFALTVWLIAPGVSSVGVMAQSPAAPGHISPIDFQQSPPTPDAAGNATVKRNANLRQGPGTNYPIVGGVTAGMPLEIVAKNQAGDWYQLADGRWIFAVLVEGDPEVEVSTQTPAVPATPAVPIAASSAAGAISSSDGAKWTLVADSAADFPGGRDRNHWYYLWTEGRGNFVWQDMFQTEGQGCYHDSANKGLQICADSITANPKGDVGLQWKASQGGTYRFEWDSASLKFYKHGDFMGILEQGAELPYAATAKDVIEWEMFFWVAADSTPFRVKVFRQEETPSAVSAPAVSSQTPLSSSTDHALTQTPTPAHQESDQSLEALTLLMNYRASSGQSLSTFLLQRASGWDIYGWYAHKCSVSLCPRGGYLLAFKYVVGNLDSIPIWYVPESLERIYTVNGRAIGFTSESPNAFELGLVKDVSQALGIFRNLGKSSATLAIGQTPSPIQTPSMAISFGNGIKVVSRDISPGTYRSMGGDFCYWERLQGFGGTQREIIANEFGEGPWIVTISASDKGFRSTQCDRWTLDLSPITASPTDPFGAGMYFVGKDIAPGTWQSSGGDLCYWERLTGFSGEFRDIKANDLLSGPAVVEISAGDQGFYSHNCGVWTRLY